jgi:hypothetical protein
MPYMTNKVWNNFAVIPKVDNLRKGNYHPVHD